MDTPVDRDYFSDRIIWGLFFAARVEKPWIIQLCRLGFVLGGTRNLSHQVVVKRMLILKSNSRKTCVFFWYRQGQKGTDRAQIGIVLTVRRNKRRCTRRVVFLMCSFASGYWFCSIFWVSIFFLAVYWLHSKGGWAYDWLVVLPTVSFCECLFAREKEVCHLGRHGISEWYEIIIFSVKVVSVYPLTDRNCVSKSAVIL